MLFLRPQVFEHCVYFVLRVRYGMCRDSKLVDLVAMCRLMQDP